jgi:hypothetical protein
VIPTRPSLDTTIEALRSMGEHNDDGELHDLIATAEYVNFDHQSVADEYSTRHGWGVCETCDTNWPCATWKTTEYAIVEWLIKSSTCLLAKHHKWR